MKDLPSSARLWCSGPVPECLSAFLTTVLHKCEVCNLYIIFIIFCSSPLVRLCSELDTFLAARLIMLHLLNIHLLYGCFWKGVKTVRIEAEILIDNPSIKDHRYNIYCFKLPLCTQD